MVTTSRLAKMVLLFAPVATLAACGGGGESTAAKNTTQAASAAGCPSEAEVRQAVERFENRNQITDYNKSIWHVEALKNFKFSAMQFGDIAREQVKWGTEAQEACPVRFTYTYDLVQTDGTVKPREFGTGLIFYFFRNPFHEWDYRYGSG